MSLELRQMRHVLALAEHGNFARAAAALHLSQPALSRSIQSIEQQIGTGLFSRTSNGVVPTDIGRLFVQRARHLVRMAAEFDREVLGDPTLQIGHVAVGAGPYPAESILSVALARFIAAYPVVSVRMQVGNWDELLRRLRAREVDFFVAEISTLQAEYDLQIEPLAEHPLFFVARSGHPLAGRGEVTAADTFAFPFVAPSRIPPRVLEPMLKAQREASAPAAVARAFPSLECGSLAVMKRIVADSDAITAVTLPCVSAELADHRLTLLGRAPWLSVHYGLVGLKGQPLSRAAEGFREFVIDAERMTSIEEDRLRKEWACRTA
jgi:DNA-binding transcriptional LysR family regulator